MKNKVNISQEDDRHYADSDFWNVMLYVSQYYK